MRLGSKRSSKTRYSSYRRQNSSNNLESKPKERGTSAHQRPQSAKDPGQKDSNSKYAGGFAFGANCDYKNPEEFHKLRYSLAHNQENKARRPSSARRKDDNPLKYSSNEVKPPQEYNLSNKIKSYYLDRDSFLNQIEMTENSSKPSGKEEYKFNHYELKKNKIYESKNGERRESRKRSSSKDRTNEPHKSKYSHTYNQKNLNRSRSNKGSSRVSERSTDRNSDNYRHKSKSSADTTPTHKPSFHNTASLKFNNILRDMGAHAGSSSSSQFFNYTESLRNRDGDVSDISRPKVDYEKHSSKYSSNLEASSKSKDKNILKPNDIFMMNSNTNHHHQYMFNANPQKGSSRQQSKYGPSSGQHLDTSNNNLNSSFKGRNPVIGVSSTSQGSGYHKGKPGKKIAEATKHKEDPAIPFPQSQKHRSSKLSPNDIEFASSK